jgi:hypothetical protein
LCAVARTVCLSVCLYVCLSAAQVHEYARLFYCFIFIIRHNDSV